MDDADVLKVTCAGPIVTLTINRPEARNAINSETAFAIGHALDEAEGNPEIRVVIVTGAGDRAFCAGADLKSMAQAQQRGPSGQAFNPRGFAGLVSHPISKPLIAAVNGFALGGGTEIVLACDLAIASSSATFGLPEVKRGIMAGAGGAFRIVQQLPAKLGMEMLLTGDPINADKALAFGFVNAVVPPGDLLASANALAERIAVNAPLSVQASKRVAKGLREGQIAADEPHWELTRLEAQKLHGSLDAREGPQAFAEKRAPIWQAR